LSEPDISPLHSSLRDRVIGDGTASATDVALDPIDPDLPPRTRPDGPAPGVAYSGGVDSVAAVALLPGEPRLYYLDRIIPADGKGAIDKQAALVSCDDMERHGRLVRRIPCDVEYLRRPTGAPVNLPTDLSFALPAVLCADLDGLDALVTGILATSVYGLGSGRFAEPGPGHPLRQWQAVTAAAGLPLQPVAAGLTEAATPLVVEQAWAGSVLAQSCHVGGAGRPCGSCRNCFRKSLVDAAATGRWPGADQVRRMLRNGQALADLTAVPMPLECSLVDSLSRYDGDDPLLVLLRDHVCRDGADAHWMGLHYAPALDLLDERYREGVAERVARHVKPMRDDEIEAFRNWDVVGKIAFRGAWSETAALVEAVTRYGPVVGERRGVPGGPPPPGPAPAAPPAHPGPPPPLDTDEGIYGLGEVGIRSRQRAVAGGIEHLADLIVGEDPARIEHLWQVMFRRGFFPADRFLSAAIAAIDVALWDIRGKALGVPVYELLGGKVRDRVPCYTHLGDQYTTAAALPDRCRQLVSDGWRHLRFAVPYDNDGTLDARRAMRDTIALFHAAREAVGDDVELILDVHTRLDPPEAVTLCREIESARPYFVEDPLRAESLSSYHTLRSRTTVPLATGEVFGSKWDFQPLVENELIDYARVDVAVAAGLTEARKIAAMCETHYIKLATHNPLGPVTAAASLHLNLASAYVGVQEHQIDPEPATAALFTTRPQVRDGWLEPSQHPGLGVDIDREAARRLRATPAERPHLRNPDGAFTNW
jgi:galactonate dehydratase